MKRLAIILVLLFWLNIFLGNRITHITLALIITLVIIRLNKRTVRKIK
ncbi:hypothetical protein HMPREF0793_2049 [Staphylococcus caprae M23864:W1]|nr:hypothetical protein HMPREF0793_2049 [Staphylococcus caprae M23864:W1]